MSNFNEKLQTLLKTDSRFVDQEWDLLKNEIIDKAFKIDEKLIELLITDTEAESKFFSEIKNHWVFNINKFVDFIQDKDFLNDSYTKYKNKIWLNIDGKFLNERKEVSLVRPYRDCVLEGWQSKEDQKRKEIFFNEVLAQDEIDRLFDPKVLTNWKKYTKEGELKIETFTRDEEWTIKDNLIIKGNNLLALHTIKKELSGKVKLIYIDPPYNTGSDSFGYNDSFNHSTWLTFMKNRLEVAKDLLKNDWVIFISINHIELAYILVLMDEIFGEKNKLPIITLRAGTTASYRSINECPVNVTEYVIWYKKENYESTPIFEESSYSEDYGYYITNIDKWVDERVIRNLNDLVHEQEWCRKRQEFKIKFGGQWKKIRFEKKEKFALANSNMVVSLNTLQKPSIWIQNIIDQSKRERNQVFEYKREKWSSIYCYNWRTLAFFSWKFKEIDGEKVPTEILTNLRTDISFLGIWPEWWVNLPNGKKPEQLIKKILDLATKDWDIVLDYHLWSWTTAAVCHKLWRQYIWIEQLFYWENDSIERLKNVISGDESWISDAINRQWWWEFIYCELKKYNQDFVIQIQKAKDAKNLLKIWADMKSKGFLNYNVDIKKQEESIEEFKNLSLDQQKSILIELLDKNQLYVNLSEINDKDFDITKEDKTLNNLFYEL